MSAIIKTLKTKTDETEQSVYPKTVLEAVVDAETNQTLDVILDNLTVGTQSGTAYVDFDEQSGEVTGEVEKVTSASLVDYDNSASGIEGSNVQEAIDEVKDNIDNINTELTKKVNTTDIVDNLESIATDLPLSANQGRKIRNRLVYPSFYEVPMDAADKTWSVASLLSEVRATYTVDDVKAIIPVGARKGGNSSLYYAIYDGSYVRCSAVEGATLYVYILHLVNQQ